MITLDELERQKAQTVRLIEGWSEARLAYRPAPDEWCVAGVLDHLEKVERGITSAARNGLKNPHGIGARDRLGYWFIDRVFRTERKVKVPGSVPQVLPDADAAVPAVLRRWDETRRNVAALVDEAEAAQVTQAIFRHPIAGWMALPQVLGFFSVHIIHHEFQLKRLEAGSRGL